MDGIATRQSLRRLGKYLFTILLCTVLFSIINQQRASAAANENTQNIPQRIINYLRSCDGSVNAVAQASWLSVAGRPLDESTTVPYGATSVNLQINVIVYVCRVGLNANGDVAASRIGTNFGITNSSPATLGITGRQALVTYDNPPNNRFNVSTIPFTYTFPPATRSQNHTISYNNKAINRKRAGGYECVTNPGTPNNYVPSNYSDFGACNSIGGATLSIYINVGPRGDVNTVTSNCSAIRGLAEDGDSPNTPIEIHVYKDYPAGTAPPWDPGNRYGGIIGSTTANEITNAYTFDISSHADASAHTYYVYMLGVNSAGAKDDNNPQAGNSPLVIGPCLIPTCGSITLDPSPPSPGVPFNTTVSFSLSRATVVSYSISFSNLAGDSGNIIYTGANPIHGMTRTTNISETFNNMVVPSAGTYFARFVINGSARDGAAFTLTCDFNGSNGRQPIFVPARPYYRIYGGDAFVGSAFKRPDGSCLIETRARFIGFNAPAVNGSTNAYQGAGTQLASLALDAIQEHVSAGTRLATPLPPKGITFANDTAGAYGGNLNDVSATCAPNYFGERTGTDPGASLNLNPGLSGKYNRTGDLVLTAAIPGVGGGQEVIVYVEGDVFIENDILYENSGSYANIAAIPKFMLIVEGNIYINPRVTQIDGILIAQPRLNPVNTGTPVANTGLVVTCAYRRGLTHATRLPTDSELTQSGPAGCRSKLTIVGAVLAASVRTLRTNGNLQNTAPLPRPTIRLSWTSAGHAALSANPSCASLNEPEQPPAHTWADNYICGSSTNNDLGLQYSITGPIAGKTCTLMREPAEPDTPFLDSGTYNNYLCINSAYGGGVYGDYGLAFALRDPSAGLGDSRDEQQAQGKTCVPISESADPNTWHDNYICYWPNGSVPSTPPIYSTPATRASPELSSSVNIAETFIYTPEVWLGGTPNSSDGLNSITSLPPVL